MFMVQLTLFYKVSKIEQRRFRRYSMYNLFLTNLLPYPLRTVVTLDPVLHSQIGHPTELAYIIGHECRAHAPRMGRDKQVVIANRSTLLF